MSRMIHSKYGYEPPEWVQADSRLDKWCKNRKRRAKQHGAFNLENKTKPVYQVSQDDGFNSEKKGN
ncbi:hypothetical protein [Lactiplantibacillus plantarum]|uniref:hypothetical protein n=1 Tax=Lactiplantibacillus plantarum TaxID=1590 RepID=UPI0002BF2348|nr:hypothetical protein [Lactiplantibacillus plantarum]EMP45472.1 prophage protein 32 [Lactiplantibacillus plantarum UCMA 3037]RDF95360.1 hypothetical protein DQM15_13305 [Lactiplantibacillus plantarum]